MKVSKLLIIILALIVLSLFCTNKVIALNEVIPSPPALPTFCEDSPCQQGETCQDTSLGASCTKQIKLSFSKTSSYEEKVTSTLSIAMDKLTADKPPQNYAWQAITLATEQDAGLKEASIVYKETDTLPTNAKPTTETIDEAHAVYKYEQVNPLNTPETVSVTIDFSVSKSWLTENNIDAETIALYKFLDTENVNEWIKLQTQKTSEDTTNVYYASKTLGFSTFAIIGKQKTEVRPASTISTNPVTARRVSSYKTQKKSIAQILKAPVAGDSKCDNGETFINACVDCGCPTGKTCLSNVCVEKNEVVSEVAVEEAKEYPKVVSYVITPASNEFVIFWFLIALAIIIAFGYVVYDRRDEFTQILSSFESPKELSTNKIITTSLAHNHTPNEIKKNLIDKGYSEKEVNMALNNVAKNTDELCALAKKYKAHHKDVSKKEITLFIDEAKQQGYTNDDLKIALKEMGWKTSKAA